MKIRKEAFAKKSAVNAVKKKKGLRCFLTLLRRGFLIGVELVLFLVVLNFLMLASMRRYALSVEEAGRLEEVDCILVLGCLVRSDGSMSGMLLDRMSRGMDVFETGVSDRVLVSGDHGSRDYDEVNAMKSYAVRKGIDPDAVFMDHAGFSTYESMYRAAEVFGVERVLIITQGYHLPRALYNARSLGIEAYGVAADQHIYAGRQRFYFREAFARAKDILYCMIKPQPKYLGEKIDLRGSGRQTDD